MKFLPQAILRLVWSEPWCTFSFVQDIIMHSGYFQLGHNQFPPSLAWVWHSFVQYGANVFEWITLQLLTSLLFTYHSTIIANPPVGQTWWSPSVKVSRSIRLKYTKRLRTLQTIKIKVAPMNDLCTSYMLRRRANFLFIFIFKTLTTRNMAPISFQLLTVSSHHPYPLVSDPGYEILTSVYVMSCEFY